MGSVLHQNASPCLVEARGIQGRGRLPGGPRGLEREHDIAFESLITKGECKRSSVSVYLLKYVLLSFMDARSWALT